MLTSKKHRVSLLVTLGVIVLSVIGWQFYKYRLAHDKISDAVANGTKGLYTLQYEGLTFDEVAGTLHVKNIEISPDTTIYNQMVKEKTDPSTLLSIRVPVLDITGVKTPKALLNKELIGGRVEVTNPTIEIMVNHSKKDSTVYNPTTDLTKQLLGKLLKIQVDSVKITNANVLVSSMDAKEVFFKGNKVSLLLSHLLIDSSAGKDTSTILFSRNMEVSCEELELPTRNKKYGVHIAGLRFTSIDNTLRIAQVKLTPRLSETAFAASLPVQKDRYDFNLEGIRLVNIDRKSLWHKTLKADSLVIVQSSFKVYRDLSRPPDTIIKEGKFPQQQLMQLPLPLTIGDVVFLHSFIEYKEKNAKSDRAGKLQFFDVGATIHHVTNRREDIARDNKCLLIFHARLIDKAPVNARLVMLLKDPHGKFTIEGGLGTIDAQSLNPLTEPMALARMEKGKINSVKFSITGADSASEGRVVILYDDIKISLLKKNREEDKFDKKGMASLLANMIIKKSNKAEDPRIEEVHFKRMVNMSFFNLIWKTIFTGVKKTVGMK